MLILWHISSKTTGLFKSHCEKLDSMGWQEMVQNRLCIPANVRLKALAMDC